MKLSKTTRRELKKRYHNVWLKWLVANLMVFSIQFSLQAGTSDQLETVVYSSNNFSKLTISADKIIDLEGKNLIYKDLFDASNGSVFNVKSGKTLSFVNSENNPLLTFENNYVLGSSTSYGGVLYSSKGGVSFEVDTLFANNFVKAEADSGKAYGGVFYVSGASKGVEFDKYAIFQNNESILDSDSGASYGGALYVSGGAVSLIDTEGTSAYAYTYGVVFNEGALFEGNKATGESSKIFGGAVYNSGYMLFKGNTIFGGEETVINAETGELENISLGNFAKTGGAVYNASGKQDDNGIITYGIIFEKSQFINNTALNSGALHNTGGVKFSEETYFIDNKATDGNGGAIGNTKYLTFEDKSIFKNNVALDNAGGINNTGSIQFNDSVLFDHNEASKKGGAIYNSGSGEILFNNESVFSSNQSELTGGAIYNSATLNFLGETRFFNNVSFERGGAIYNYQAGKLLLGGDTLFVGNQSLGNGGALYNYGTGVITITHNAVFSDNYNDIQKDADGNIIQQTANDIYVRGGKLNFEGGFISDQNGNITDQRTVVSLTGGIINTATINKSGAGILILGDETNNSGTGVFNQTDGLTIAPSERFFTDNNNISGGDLKTHGSEIKYNAVISDIGTITHLGTSTETPTEIKGISFDGHGLNLTLGSYTKIEQEKEKEIVKDKYIEYEDKNGNLVSYHLLDKLFTGNSLENDQKAQFILKENLEGAEGNSITINNAEIEVLNGLKVASKLVLNDAVLSKNMTEMSLSELELAKGSSLDIRNIKIITDKLNFLGENNVSVTINSLKDYGQILSDTTNVTTEGSLTLDFIGLPEEGEYKIFESDSNLKLITTHDFFDIKDSGNGTYQVNKKSVDVLSEKFELSLDESQILSSVIDARTTHDGFKQVQLEMINTLQNEKSKDVKKALSAIGTSEQSSAQAVSSNHVGAVGNVVGGEMKGGATGRAGGEEEARAKVYIKGLYDKTKSTMGEGFKARSQGAVLGVQSEVTDALTLGVGYATSQTTAKEDLRRTEADTNTAFISAHYQPNAWWMSGLATYSRGQYDEQKQVLSSVGIANYDVDSWGVQVMTGYDIKLADTVITPEVGLRYLSVKQEGYTDTLGTTVEATSSDYLTAIAGIKGSWDLGKIRPSVGVNVGYDVISDDVATLNTLANGASYTVNAEALDRLSVGVTTGIEAKLGDRTTLKLEYNGSFRKEYTDHSGMLKLEMRF